jgi:hypothetical protein
MPTKLRKHLKQVWPHKNPTEILLQHGSAKPHTSLKTLEAITEFGWTVLPHPSYSPHLEASNFHIFGELKDAISTEFETNDDMIHIVRIWLHEDRVWYQQSLQKCICSLLVIKWTHTLWSESNHHSSQSCSQSKNKYLLKKWGISIWATIVHSSQNTVLSHCSGSIVHSY